MTGQILLTQIWTVILGSYEQNPAAGKGLFDHELFYLVFQVPGDEFFLVIVEKRSSGRGGR